MKTTRILITLLILLIGSGMAQATTIEVCNTCGNTTINGAMGFAVNGDVLNITSDILIENTNIINKTVAVEGNGHTVNISLPTSSKKGIELHGTPAIFNNLTINLLNRYNTIFLVESTDFGGKTWNNIRIKADNTVPDTLAGLTIPNDIMGIAIWGSSNLTINNYTTQDILVPVFISESNSKSANIRINGNGVMNRSGVGGLTNAVELGTNIENISLDGFDSSGYNIGLAGGAFNGGTCGDGTINCFPKNITYRGTLKSNKYGVRFMGTNFTILNSILVNDIDVTILGDMNYILANTSLSSLVSLPNATNFNVSKWSLNKIVVAGKEYSVAGIGYNISVNITVAPPYRLTLAFNKTIVQYLNIDPTTLRVYHIINTTSNETLTPIEINTTQGTLTIQTNSFSPFVIFGEPYAPEATPTPTPSTPTSSSGSGGGGVVTDEDFDNINNYQRIDGNLQAGKEVRYNFNKVGAGIFYTTVTGKENEYDVTIRVENLKAQSKKALTPVPNIVYLYTNILSSSQRIQSAKIGFKVPNTWLDSNKIDPSTIKMYRLVNGSWNVLETKLVGSDAENSIYEAASAGFSKFAITGEVQPAIQPTAVIPTPVSKTTPNIVMTVRQDTPKPVQETPKATSGFELALGAISVVSIYLWRRNHK